MDGWVGALGREGEVHAQSVNVGGKATDLPSLRTPCVKVELYAIEN